MASESRTFTNIDRAKMNALRERVGTLVRLPEGDRGAVSGQGASGSFDYNESAKTLTLTLDELPPFVPRAMVWSMIENALRS